MVDKRTSVMDRERLVRTETGRTPARKYRTENQELRSIRTGTDFPAGTRLSIA